MDNFKPTKSLITILVVGAVFALGGIGATYLVMKSKIESLKATERKDDCVTLQEAQSFGRASFRFGYNRGYVLGAFETDTNFQEGFLKDSLNFDRLILESEKISKNANK